MFRNDEDDWMPNWVRRRRYPFSERSLLDEFEAYMREMHEYMQREFQELAKRAPKDLRQTRVLPDGSKIEEWGPFVYGYTLKIGPDGKTQLREFGNIKRQPQLGNRVVVDIKKEREPLVDVYLVNGYVKVTAELPGVDKSDIKLYGTEDTLTISVETSERSYYKEIELPTKVNIRKSNSTFKNGVLEVNMLAYKEDQPKGEFIKID